MALSLVLSMAPNLPKPYPVNAVPLWTRPNIWETTIIGSCIFDPHPLRGSFWGDDTAIHVQSMLRKAKHVSQLLKEHKESWSILVLCCRSAAGGHMTSLKTATTHNN